MVQLSATPRHVLVCTDQGECWTHEEAKGWRKVIVSEDIKDNEGVMCKTSCGDAHNLALDNQGMPYSLPSPLQFDAFPADKRHKVSY